MEYERKGVTINWQIENAKYVRKRKMELYSPLITVDVMDGTKWKLGMHRMSESTVWLTIEREEEDNGPEEYGLHYEFSVNELQGTSSVRKRVCTHRFQKCQRSPEVAVNYRKFGMCLTPDAIPIRCKLWKKNGSISKTGHFFVRTRMKTECCIFIGEIQNFSSFYLNQIKTLKVLSSSANEKLMTVNLRLYRRYPLIKTTDYDMKIEVIPKDNEEERLLNLKFFILDSSGNKTDIGKLDQEFTLKSYEQFHLPDVSKMYLKENPNLYLPNDTLSMHCEITFCSGKEYEKLESVDYEMDFVPDEKLTDVSNALEFLTSKVNTLCDTSLKTLTETFPAHTAILSAQSPIFEAMFKTNMQETIQKCVYIDDVEAETVKRLLVFLYSDCLEELGWKEAMKLYFAADKYQIVSLKIMCAARLKESIDLSNCCVLLLLSDMHQDEFLKAAATNYIAEYGREVLYSDQWRDIERNLPEMAIQTLRDVFLGSMLK